MSGFHEVQGRRPSRLPWKGSIRFWALWHGTRWVLGLVGAWLCVDAADFYVSPSGKDSNSGTSPKAPWRTLQRVNRHVADHRLSPGDGLFFEGGAIFDGGLRVEHAGGGTPQSPVRITSYGRGQATLRPGLESGLLIRETAWITVSRLNFTGASGNLGDGIRCDRDQEAPERVAGLVIQDCSVTGFGWHGIMVDASQRSMGFEDVTIERCLTSSNRYAGIMVYGGNPAGRRSRPHAGVRIEDCVAVGNPGDPDERKHHSGSGIFIDGVDTAVIRGCVAAGNGAACRNERGGPVGIWAHACRRVTIEGCESYGNQSCLRDGGGFDLDGGCEESSMVRNFSHHNHGPGFLVYTYSGAAYADRDCQVRENISWNDGAKSSGYAGIQLGAEDGGELTGLVVERNTVIAPVESVAALRVMGRSIQACIRGNLIVVPAHGTLVSISGLEHRVRFEENRYWRADGKPVFLVDLQWTLPALDAWHNDTGPDHRFVAVGEVFADPGLRLPKTPEFKSLRRRPSWPRLSHRFPSECGAPEKPGFFGRRP